MQRHPLLAAHQLAWGPSKDKLIIRDVGLSIEAGDRLAIIGPNGAGKSTLLRCLYRNLRPLKGSVLFDGNDLWSIAPREVARRIAVVLQETPGDFPFSVRDIVMMGRIPHRKGVGRWSDEDHDATAASLARLDLLSLASRRFSSLSGGEKQRVLVARALAQTPEVIILDEPTNHLDIRHQLEVLALLKTLDLTIVTTLHDINFVADFATHVAVIHAGRASGYGTPDDVLTTQQITAAFGVSAEIHHTGGNTARRFTFSLQS
ncbi:ABC transporter ATP-binding protein [Rhizobium sp. BK491]|uniref:ABC transporter ATP-binding protein n=1 Tax=Rhizobium sp. BK491 TaxID=2587009 RepID=UPI0016209382|nr:ABC transporter ATP-binding protein [Rhizobium sp. BK491]